MDFKPDRRFETLTEAFEFILNRYAQEPAERVWLETGSGLLVPEEVPKYLFRGECGEFASTMAGTHRPETYALRDGSPLATQDVEKLQKLMSDLVRRFMASYDYSLDQSESIGLLQHYGLPTTMVDLSGQLGLAFAFAVAGLSRVGRVCVIPTGALSARGRLVNLSRHQWAERPRRQAAFAAVMGEDLIDLKSKTSKSELRIEWYEFPISESDRAFLRSKYDALVSLTDDPSAGFLRFHITEYVEAFGKFSPALTDWLLERIPIAPRCYLVKAFEGKDVIVNHRSAEALQGFASDAERECSRRYWSTAYCDKSWDRMTEWKWPPAGSVVADPRTHHSKPLVDTPTSDVDQEPSAARRPTNEAASFR